MTAAEELREESVVEAVLFTMGTSVEVHQLAAALQSDETAARKAAERLKNRYEEKKGGISIIELDGAYQMCTGKEYYDALIRVAKTPKRQVLSESVLETLSIVAYRQPVTRAEIENIRGVSCEYALNRLIEFGLVYEAGRLDTIGHPACFATTEEFLRRFGIGSKKNLPDIPAEKAAEIAREVEKEVGFDLGTGEEKAQGGKDE